MDTMQTRRGVFPTPLPFAKKACEYLDKMLGADWFQTGTVRLWDMAAGTGHLEHFLPTESLKYCYLSTLEHEDVKHLKQEFPQATVFQYDYLEETSIPPPLKNDLDNPNIKWIILVNPPYATAQEAGLKGMSKEGVANTKIRKLMHAEGLGEVSRELYVQFLYRMMNDFKHREAVLGLFAPLKYLVSTNYQKFRDNIFHATFQSGFIFSSENFGGTSKTKHFPVSFIVWDISQRQSIVKQEIQLDILDNMTQKIGTKMVKPANRSQFLSRWVKRPRGVKIFPPFSSALTIKPDNVDTRNRIADGFLASLMCPGNELQNQQQTAFLSGPQASAGALSVTPDNFEQAVVVFAARRIPKDTWVNHVDQLMRPNRDLSPQFIADCAVWSLFDKKNQTVSMDNVMYQGQVYHIVNHFFPFPSFCCENKKTFVADWLLKQTLSAPSQAVLDCAREIYRLYYANGAGMDDAGWYQIQKALRDAEVGNDLLAELKQLHEVLGEAILPALCDYGILGFR